MSRNTTEPLLVLLVQTADSDEWWDEWWIERWRAATRQNGGRLQLARSLEEGLQQLGTSRFNLVILDSDHTQVWAAFSRLLAAAPDPPLLVCHSQEDQELAIDLLEAGAQDVVMRSDHVSVEAMQRMIRYTLARHHSQEHFHTLFNNIADPVFIHDFEGRILEVNQAAVQQLGYSREELLSLKPYNLDTTGQRSFVPERLQKLRQEGSLRFVTEHRRKDGSTFPAEVSTRLIHYQGRQLILSTARDVSARQTTEQQLQLQVAALQAAANAIIISDTSGRILWVNDAFTRLTGYSATEALGQNPRLLKSGVHDADFYRDLWTTVKRGEVWKGELVNQRKDGTLYTEEMTITPVRQKNGEVSHFIAIKQDVSERKRREKELNTIASMSNALRHGQRRSEMLPLILEELQSLLKAHSGAIAVLSHENSSIVFEQTQGRWRSRQGAVIPADSGLTGWVLANREPFYTDDLASEPGFLWDQLAQTNDAAVCIPLIMDNNPEGALWLVRDQPFTEPELNLLHAVSDLVASSLHRATLYERIETQALQLQRILETIPTGILLLDAGHRLVLANPAGTAFLNELLEEPCEDPRGCPVTHLRSVPVKRGSYRLSMEAPQRQELEIDVHPVRKETEMVGWVVVLRDVTEALDRQAQQQQRERLAAVGQLAAGIAHDFNNILTTIILYTQTLQKDLAADVAANSKLEVIYQQAQNAAALVRQILDFSRSSSMQRRPVDLVPFCKETIKLWQRTLPEYIQIQFRSRQPTYRVLADPALLQQALMNLAINARDAMPEGGLMRLELEAPGAHLVQGQPVSPRNWVCLRFRDTGNGIPPDVLPRIFDPFFTTKAPGKGSGLGLAQVYGIIRQHEGYITADSQTEQGTTFSIYLPLAESLPRPEIDTDSNADMSDGPRNKTILVVEDEQLVQSAVAETLEGAGYHVITAPNGKAALALLGESARLPDLVITDMIMPVMGGSQLHRQLQENYPRLPVLMMSGYASSHEQPRPEGQPWLSKPFEAGKLLEKVEALLSEHSMEAG